MKARRRCLANHRLSWWLCGLGYHWLAPYLAPFGVQLCCRGGIYSEGICDITNESKRLWLGEFLQRHQMSPTADDIWLRLRTSHFSLVRDRDARTRADRADQLTGAPVSCRRRPAKQTQHHTAVALLWPPSLREKKNGSPPSSMFPGNAL